MQPKKSPRVKICYLRKRGGGEIAIGNIWQSPAQFLILA